MIIDGRQIGPGHPPFVVAELAGEHRGDRYRALDLIKAAKDAGADAAKLQCFEPDALAEARGGRHKLLTEGLWAGRTLGDLYQETYTPREWFPELFAYAKEIGITLFSSVFDEEDVEFLETLGCPAYKISSFEATNLALIECAALTQKPTIISLGMTSDGDVRRAVIATIHGGECAALLHCVSAYPCQMAAVGALRIRDLRYQYRALPIGFSDHTLGTTAAIVATALGACIIEKHITLSRAEGGPDAPFSLEPHEFAKLVQDVRDAYASLGSGERPASEGIYRSLRRRST